MVVQNEKVYDIDRASVIISLVDEQRKIINSLPEFAKITLHLGSKDVVLEFDFKATPRKWRTEDEPTK